VAVKLRLARHGQKKKPFYRIVATEKESRRDGRYIEVVGTYNPKSDPPAVTLKEDKIRKWIAGGAQPSRVVSDLIGKRIPGLIKERAEAQRQKIQAQRKKRKARAKDKPRPPAKAKKD
jgi:small subunit ribosomal protein S16